MTNKIIAEYIWLGGKSELRSKARTIVTDKRTLELSDLPNWDYDGSSTNQADGKNSEVIIKPRAIFPCPFRKNSNILVMCDTYTPQDQPLFNNHRDNAVNVFNKCLQEKPWFGIEQEFFMIDGKTQKPVGFPLEGNPNPQGQYYCSVGAGNAVGREFIEEHYQACLDANINISGINAEVALGQWEYQIGPCEGIESGDHLWMSRYILQRVAEKYNVIIDFEPKPVPGDWNGSGCHTNYSTLSMREGNDNNTGLDVILQAIDRLGNKHNEHMKIYGTGNELRMTGLHETSRYDEFSFGVANRGSSVRIPNKTKQQQKGYFEDRRPSSNMDPYQVTSKIFETTVTAHL
ncbi:Glutamine synthetase, catalytic domain [seawater metagenome]|uniref:glutamine synthetase n=1 Tax=seawater metagenome TaxID=1561972 RepID=A0A5E8CLS3_9ZZZZ